LENSEAQVDFRRRFCKHLASTRWSTQAILELTRTL
jgi:hypothetical protein